MSYDRTTYALPMKKLSVFLLLLGLVGCKYPSMYEAKEACKEWDNPDPGNVRFCEVEKATNQILGEELIDGKLKIVKHFRY